MDLIALINPGIVALFDDGRSNAAVFASGAKARLDRRARHAQASLRENAPVRYCFHGLSGIQSSLSKPLFQLARPAGFQTHDPRIRNPALYPAELRAPRRSL